MREVWVMTITSLGLQVLTSIGICPLVYSIGSFPIATTKTLNNRLRANLKSQIACLLICTMHQLAYTLYFYALTVHPPFSQWQRNIFVHLPHSQRWNIFVIPYHFKYDTFIFPSQLAHLRVQIHLNNPQPQQQSIFYTLKVLVNLSGSSYQHFDKSFKVKR